MDSIDYSTKLVKEFGIDQSDAIKMLDIETDDMRIPSGANVLWLLPNENGGTTLMFPEDY